MCVCVPETRQHVMAAEADIAGIGWVGGSPARLHVMRH